MNGVALTGTGTFSGQTASYPTVAIAGLNMTPQLFVAPSSATVREFVTFQNPTAAPITVPVVLSTNLGSDGGTQIVTTRNGNTTFEIADRWLVTDDADLTGGDPTVTTVLFGPGTPSVTPTAVTTPTGTGNFTATYNLTIPAGQTKAMVFFHQISTTAAIAQRRDNQVFDVTPVAGNDLFAGLTPLQRSQIANYVVNNAPTAANNAITVNEDAGSTTVPVFANDFDADGDALSVTAVTAAANGTVAITGGTGVSYRPNANFNGADTFTYTVSDGAGGSKTATVNVTVTAVNDRPTISNIPNKTVAAGVRVGPIGFTVGDLETPAAALTLTAASSNPTLVPVAAVTFGGTGADRTVTVTPAAGQSGTATITVTVTDATGGTATDTFTVTVNPLLTAQPILIGGRPDGTATVFRAGTDGTLAAGATINFGLGGSARTATADVNNDGVPDFVGGAGPGGTPRVVIIDGANGNRIADFLAFEASFTGGVYVAAGDLNRDGRAEVVVTPDQGGGPIVAVYDGRRLSDGQNAGAQINRYLGIDAPTFRGGCRAAIGDVDGDGIPDVIVSAGFLGGPRIALFDGKDAASGSGTPKKLIADFFAFEDTVRNGAILTAGDVNGDGRADLAFGGGPNGGPQVRVIDGKGLLAAGGFSNLDQIGSAQLGNLLSGDGNSRGGVRVSLRDVTGDGRADLVTGSGDKQASSVRLFDAVGLLGGSTDSKQVDPFGGVLANGVFVG